VLFVRGSGSGFDSYQASAFKNSITSALHSRGIGSVEWAELGNLDGDYDPPEKLAATEYPAVRVDKWSAANTINGNYNNSVTIGKNELATHLNDRYAGDGPTGSGSCSKEVLILGGYSQGADVIGRALNSGQLGQAVWDHIGFVALYGDPRFYPGSVGDRIAHANFQPNWWWVRGDDPGYFVNPFSSDLGVLGARNPYAPNVLKGRFGSWCAAFDLVCTGWPFGLSIHAGAYQNTWIPNSAGEIAYVAKLKYNQLNNGGSASSVSTYVTTPPATAEPKPWVSASFPTTDSTRLALSSASNSSGNGA